MNWTVSLGRGTSRPKWPVSRAKSATISPNTRRYPALAFAEATHGSRPGEQHDVGDDVEYESWHPNEHCPKWHPAPSEVVRQDTRHAEGEDARSQPDDVITESEKASP